MVTQHINLEARLQGKRTDSLRTAVKYSTYSVRVFGSVARGEADSDSDVDFTFKREARTLKKRDRSIESDLQPLTEQLQLANLSGDR